VGRSGWGSGSCAPRAAAPAPGQGLRYTSAVQIEVNGQPREVPDGTTVVALLEALGLGSTLVAVERNEEIVPRAEHARCVLGAGDRVEVVEFVGGG